MITEQDLKEAIAEIRGRRNPTSTDCQKLAAYYTILDHLAADVTDDEIRGATAIQARSYNVSNANAPANIKVIDYQFKDKTLQDGLQGKSIDYICDFLDDLMQALEYLNPELYRFAIRRLK